MSSGFDVWMEDFPTPYTPPCIDTAGECRRLREELRNVQRENTSLRVYVAKLSCMPSYRIISSTDVPEDTSYYY